MLLLTMFPADVLGGAECLPIRIHHRIAGESGWQLGASLAPAGDINADGVPDLAVGAPGLPPNGAILVLSGADFVELRRYAGADGVPVGEVVASAGDVDADGVQDLLVGSPRAGVFPAIRRGLVRVYSGASGALIHEFVGGQSQAEFGRSVAGPGDYDADGHDDIAIGQPFADNAVFYYSGRTGLLLARHEPPNNTQVDFARSLSAVGDMNGDRVPDLLVGVPNGSFGSRLLAGYVWPMRGLRYELLHDIVGPVAGLQLGTAVAGIGDVTGDGRPDFAAGGPGANSLVRVFSGADGVILQDHYGPPGTGYGSVLAAAGDFNGDHRGDLLVGAPGVDGSPSPVGRAWVLSEPDGATLFEVSGGVGDFLGAALTSPGDLDGDNRHDFAVGSPMADPTAAAIDGGLVTIYGAPAPCVDVMWRANDAACFGRNHAVTASMVNCSELTIEVQLDGAGPAGAVMAVAPGESTVVALETTPPINCPDGEPGSVSFDVIVAYAGCPPESPRTITIPVTCENCYAVNCPRPLNWWEQACRVPGNGKFTSIQLEAIAQCVDDRVALVSWPGELETLCEELSAPPRGDESVPARQEFLALVANTCAGPHLLPGGDMVRLNRSTPISIPESDCPDIECLIGELDTRLAGLADTAPDAEVRAEYREIRQIARRINGGQDIGPVCTPGADATVSRGTASPTVAHGDGSMVLRWTDISAGRISIELFDVGGRRLRQLWSGHSPGGPFEVSVALKGPGGPRLSSGLYFVRATHSDRVDAYRVVIVD